MKWYLVLLTSLVTAMIFAQKPKNPPPPRHPHLFTTSLADPIYQDKAWLNASLDIHDKSGLTEYNSVLEKFRGHRFDKVFLAEYRSEFTKNPTPIAAFRQAVAIFAFMGTPCGERGSYANGNFESRFGMKEYWDLATNWPIKPSPIYFKLRTQLFALIGGNIGIRLKAARHYLEVVPFDDEVQRLRISIVSFTYKLNPKQPKSKIMTLQKESSELFSRHPTETVYLANHYNVTAQSADILGDRVLSQEAVKLGESLVQKIKGNKYDSFDLSSIKASLQRRKLSLHR